MNRIYNFKNSIEFCLRDKVLNFDIIKNEIKNILGKNYEIILDENEFLKEYIIIIKEKTRK